MKSKGVNVEVSLASLLEEAHKAGIIEVVNWLEYESNFGIPKALTKQSQKDWEAKLKEWKIK